MRNLTDTVEPPTWFYLLKLYQKFIISSLTHSAFFSLPYNCFQHEEVHKHLVGFCHRWYRNPRCRGIVPTAEVDNALNWQMWLCAQRILEGHTSKQETNHMWHTSNHNHNHNQENFKGEGGLAKMREGLGIQLRGRVWACNGAFDSRFHKRKRRGSLKWKSLSSGKQINIASVTLRRSWFHCSGLVWKLHFLRKDWSFFLGKNSISCLDRPWTCPEESPVCPWARKAGRTQTGPASGCTGEEDWKKSFRWGLSSQSPLRIMQLASQAVRSSSGLG